MGEGRERDQKKDFNGKLIEEGKLDIALEGCHSLCWIHVHGDKKRGGGGL